MSQEKHFIVDVAIVGGGPAGVSTCLWCHSLGLSSVIIESAPELGGQLLQLHHPVMDYPGLPGYSGLEIRNSFEKHLTAVQAAILKGATDLALDVHSQILSIGDGTTVKWNALVIATGARNRTLGIPGESELSDESLSQSGYKDAAKFAGRKVCVIGGGDSAVEDALIAAENGSEVTLIHRSTQFKARESWYQAAVANPRISILTNAGVTSLERLDDGNIRINVAVDGTARSLDAAGVFVRLGIQPNSELVRGLVEFDEAGYIVTDSSQRTSRHEIWAAGDVCRPVCFSIAAATGHGAIAAKSIASSLNGKN